MDPSSSFIHRTTAIPMYVYVSTYLSIYLSIYVYLPSQLHRLSGSSPCCWALLLRFQLILELLPPLQLLPAAARSAGSKSQNKSLFAFTYQAQKVYQMIPLWGFFRAKVCPTLAFWYLFRGFGHFFLQTFGVQVGVEAEFLWGSDFSLGLLV